MSFDKTLRRAGVVSASTVAIVLSGGGLAMAAVSGSSALDPVGSVTTTATTTTDTVTGTTTSSTPTTTDPVTSTVDTVTGTVTGTVGTVTGTDPTSSDSPSGSTTTPTDPLPPLPEPVQSTVDTVVSTVEGVLGSAPVPVPDPGDLIPGGGGILPGGGTKQPTKHATPVTATVAAPTTIHKDTAPPTVYPYLDPYNPMSYWTAPSTLAVSAPETAPETHTIRLAGDSAPQVAGTEAGLRIPHVPGGMPTFLVILATVAVGGVAAAHVGLLQQRLTASS